MLSYSVPAVTFRWEGFYVVLEKKIHMKLFHRVHGQTTVEVVVRRLTSTSTAHAQCGLVLYIFFEIV